jgi:hypothetical protein
MDRHEKAGRWIWLPLVVLALAFAYWNLEWYFSLAYSTNSLFTIVSPGWAILYAIGYYFAFWTKHPVPVLKQVS